MSEGIPEKCEIRGCPSKASVRVEFPGHPLGNFPIHVCWFHYAILWMVPKYMSVEEAQQLHEKRMARFSYLKWRKKRKCKLNKV